jgi:hypothetical protein
MSILNVSGIAWIERHADLFTLYSNFFEWYAKCRILNSSIINVLDYSILVGVDEENMELVG